MCWQTDASKGSFRPKGAERFLPYDVVFFDPPYLYTSRLKAGTMLYRSLERLAPGEGTTRGGGADSLPLARTAGPRGSHQPRGAARLSLRHQNRVRNAPRMADRSPSR